MAYSYTCDHCGCDKEYATGYGLVHSDTGKILCFDGEQAGVLDHGS